MKKPHLLTDSIPFLWIWIYFQFFSKNFGMLYFKCMLLCINDFHDLKKKLIFVFVLNLYKEVYLSDVLVDFLR